MYLLSAVKNVIDTLKQKRVLEESREPDSYGVIHDKWSDKFDELDEIINEYEKLYNKMLTYQTVYGGLKRLQIKEE